MFLITVWLGMTLIFIIPRLAPGDPIASMVSRMSAQSGSVENSDEIIAAWRERFGLDAPWYVQYLRYLRSLATFNLGYSLAFFPAEVEVLVARSMPWTLGLLSLATLISFILGNTIGALLAWRRTPNLAKALLPVSLTFTSIPAFMLGILLVYAFAFGLKWFPFAGAYGRGLEPERQLAFVFRTERTTATYAFPQPRV